MLLSNLKVKAIMSLFLKHKQATSKNNNHITRFSRVPLNEEETWRNLTRLYEVIVIEIEISIKWREDVLLFLWPIV